ncbi:MAG: hypothetical protein KC609_13525 [Myxococcales bacterium]|nr:hypothetical protein [Myxococcales bacterium]
MRYLLIGLLLLTVAACSKKSNDSSNADTLVSPDATGDTTGGSDAMPVSCTNDEQCAPGTCDIPSGSCRKVCVGVGDCDPGQECNTEQGLCEPAASCQGDSDCTTGFCSCRATCISGKKCLSSQNCGVNEYCDTWPKDDQPVSGCFGTCRAKKGLCDPCSTNLACGNPDDQCLGFANGKRYCGKSCASDADCLAVKPGFRCDDLGAGRKQCVPTSGDCAAPGQCNKTRDCKFGEFCSSNLVCVTGCSSDTDCAQPLVCSAFRCQEACDNAQNPCEAGFDCVAGRCEIPNGCTKSADCPQKETYCDTQQNRCVPGCQVDNDCRDATKTCDAGSCVEKGCIGNYQCSFGGVCNQQTQTCESANGPYCDTCDPDSSGSCGAEENKCLSFQDEDGNDLGSFCLVACGPDPENPCPSGYQCIELNDQDGNVQGKVCHRACYQKPVGLGN